MKFLLIYVPNLRFSYKGDWSKRKLNEICLFFKGNGLSKSDLSNEGFPCILYGELYTTYKNEVISDIISKTNTTLSNPFLSRNNDLIIPGSGEDPIDIAVARAIYQNDIILGGDLNILRPKSNVSAAFLSYQLNGVRRYDIAKKAQGKSIVHLHNSDLKEVLVSIPSYDEQLHIVKLLTKIDERIQTQSKIIDTLSSQKKQIRNLIFKDIHKNANCCIQDYVIYEQPQKYIVHSTDYLSYGKDYTPVLTANQSFILGYTLEKDGIYEKGDCIIFDDFTNENKYVDFPFKVKSSALKILQTKEGLMLKFFYEYLQFLNFESTDHKRHYLSEVAVTDISVPNLKEQTFVCKIFTSFDNKLKNEEALLEKYRLQKQFFLNNLFI